MMRLKQAKIRHQGDRYVQKKLFYIILFLSAIFISGCDKKQEKQDNYDSPAPVIESPSWYREVVFYQIYPRSFKDSNNDGIGDLNGIIEKLDYLYDLGIGGIWLNPIYPTKNLDLGYDITDYREINPEFGTMEDFHKLLDEAHSRNIRIFLDLAFNDTSSEHLWFKESRSSKDNPKRDWYVWAPEPLFECNDILTVGNPFGESRWVLDPKTGEYYYHQFYESMPDLNFNNSEVRNELFNIVRFWLDRGVDGFRLDAASFYYESPETDECMNQPETHQFLKDLRNVLDSYSNRAMVGEVLLLPEETMAYLGNGFDELHMYFNSHLTTAFPLAALSGDGTLLLTSMEETYLKFPSGGHHAIVTGNHDLPRFFSLLGENIERAKVLASLQLTLPGTPFIYYGDEIGITNGNQIVVDWRDVARTPMQWDDTENAGFSEGDPWIKLSPNYLDYNVANELRDKNSLLHHYRKLIRMRNALPALQSGNYQPLESGDSAVIAYFRGKNDDWVIVIVNTSDQQKTVYLDFTQTPFSGSYGGIVDIWSGIEVTFLTPSNEKAYPFTINPRVLSILKND